MDEFQEAYERKVYTHIFKKILSWYFPRMVYDLFSQLEALISNYLLETHFYNLQIPPLV